MPTFSLYLVGALCAGAMGFAIQYGATCTVAAVEEILATGTANRLAALIEAALWVGCGVALAHQFAPTLYMGQGYAIGWTTIAGGVLLGIGAFINRACVFGSIARIGSGEWAFVFTPVGYFLASVVAAHLVALPRSTALTAPPLLLAAPRWLVAALALLCSVRIAQIVARAALNRPIPAALHPHLGTLLIGATFLVMLLSAGMWTYVDVLADIARHGMAPNAVFRLVLLAMLIAGTIIGGWLSGRLAPQTPSAAAVLRCLAGGAIMCLGGQLIPGQNDGLILIGMPLLWPYAWLAFAVMVITIAAAMLAAARQN